MKKKKVVLGVTGSIAAYKAPDLARMLIKSNFDVVTFMTSSATKFITPLTFESVTGNKVFTDLFKSSGFKHIEIANEADLIVVAPATANFIAKASSGIADDALSTIFLAADCPKIIAPAMNYRMYENVITQKNISSLEEQGIVFMGPENGKLACGEEGTGRLAEIQTIFEECLNQSSVPDATVGTSISQQSTRLRQGYGEVSSQKKSTGVQSNLLSDKNILITAGGTREKIDAVRCITNLSSGKTGSAIAYELALRGANVTLLSSQPLPESMKLVDNLKLIHFEDHKSLKKLLDNYFSKTDCLIMSAAVSDFKPVKESKDKIKREKTFSFDLKPTEDLLQSLAANKNGKLVIGFSAETKDLEENAVKKLKKKKLDMIIANDVSKNDSGIGKDYCELIVIYPNGKKVRIGKQLKTKAAAKIADLVTELMHKKQLKK